MQSRRSSFQTLPRKASGPSRRSSSVLSVIRDTSSSRPTLAKISPIHGLQRILGGSKCVRTFYGTLLLLAVSATTCCVAFTLTDVLSNLSYVTRRVERRSTLDLPKVSFCNLNPLRQSYLASYQEFLDLQEGTAAEQEALFFGSGKDCSVCVEGQVDATLFRKKYSQLPSDLKAVYGHQISDMLLSCKFQNVACSSSDFTAYVDETYGNCFSFTPMRSGLSVNSSGAENGLILELNLEVEAYVSGLSETAGVAVFVEPETRSYCSRKKQVVIAPGVDNFLALESSVSTDSCSNQNLMLYSAPWPLSKTYNSLVGQPESDDITVGTTSESFWGSTTLPPNLEGMEGSGQEMPDEVMASLQSIQKRAVSELKHPSGFPSSQNEDNERLYSSISFIKRHDRSIKFYDFLKMNNTGNVTDRHSNRNHEMREGNESFYQRMTDVGQSATGTGGDAFQARPTERAVWASGRASRRARRAAYGGGAEEFGEEDDTTKARETLSKLRVFYNSLDEEVESTTPVYPWYIAIALIGGQMALFCGLSAISIIEAAEHLLRFLKKCLKTIRPQNKVSVQSIAW